ncbi:MAG: formate dehydrogenase accessory protein FdhE [Smithellaceae bacterium]|nr:formate dehydrogenase accessory protein FdhE [Smithellaceae bacterium]
MLHRLTQALKTIETYKAASPHYNELLDILGDILILRQEYQKGIDKILFPIEERLIPVKIKCGLPLIDFTQVKFDFTKPKGYFLRLLEVAEKMSPGQTGDLSRGIISGTIDFEQLLRDTFRLETEDEPEEDDSVISFELIDLLLEECLRPELELVTEKYGVLIRSLDWAEGYCPICGREPKIGEIKDDDETRHLFCYQCGFKWTFDPVKCPFCGNEDYQSLAYFTIEGEERYRVDVCNSCNRYIKMVDFRDSADLVNLDVEDIATLHLDILAYEEGYN